MRQYSFFSFLFINKIQYHKSGNMKMERYIFVFFTLLTASSSVLAAIPRDNTIFQARTLNELAEAKKNHKHSTDRKDWYRGRRLQADGSLEVSQHVLADQFGGTAGFYHSVASGDPLPDAVVVWTRYTPTDVNAKVTLQLRMAAVDPNLTPEDHLDPSKNPTMAQFQVQVTSETDFCVKLDVTGLTSNTQYVFAFTDGTTASDVGLTKTAPEANVNVSKLTYAYFSCSHFRNGFFHPYDVASIIEDLDFWIHLGDYYYEYGAWDCKFYCLSLLSLISLTARGMTVSCENLSAHHPTHHYLASMTFGIIS